MLDMSDTDKAAYQNPGYYSFFLFFLFFFEFVIRTEAD